MEPGPPQTSEIEIFAKIVTFQKIESKICALKYLGCIPKFHVFVAEKFQTVIELRFGEIFWNKVQNQNVRILLKAT